MNKIIVKKNVILSFFFIFITISANSSEIDIVNDLNKECNANNAASIEYIKDAEECLRDKIKDLDDDIREHRYQANEYQRIEESARNKKEGEINLAKALIQKKTIANNQLQILQSRKGNNKELGRTNESMVKKTLDCTKLDDNQPPRLSLVLDAVTGYEPLALDLYRKEKLDEFIGNIDTCNNECLTTSDSQSCAVRKEKINKYKAKLYSVNATYNIIPTKLCETSAKQLYNSFINLNKEGFDRFKSLYESCIELNKLKK